MSLVLRWSMVAVLAVAATGCASQEPVSGPEQAVEDDLTQAQCRGPKGETEQACRVEGVVERQVTAEFDPFVVGDACVTFVKVGSRRYGLVQDMEACPDESKFEKGNVKVSFSKGAITLVSRARAQVLKDYDAGVTYYDFTGTLRVQAPPPPASLAEFEALPPEDKYSFLYDVQSDAWADLKPGFKERQIRILDELSGPAKSKALAAYYAIRSEALEQGGDRPDVFAIEKDGATWAYGISSGGRSYGNWWSTVVYDRAFDEIGSFGGSD